MQFANHKDEQLFLSSLENPCFLVVTCALLLGLSKPAALLRTRRLGKARAVATNSALNSTDFLSITHLLKRSATI